MNISEGSVHQWLKVTSYNDNNTNTNNNVSRSSNSTTSNNDNNNQGSPNPQVWDLRWFALLSGPLLFGTIMLPLITGPAIRYLCQSYVTLRVYWRLGFVFLAIAYLGLFFGLAVSVPTGALSLDMICSVTLTLYALYQGYNAWRFEGRRLIWIFYLLLVLLVWLLETQVIRFGPTFHSGPADSSGPADIPGPADSSGPTDSSGPADSSKFASFPFGFVGWVVLFVVSQARYLQKSTAKRRADTTAS